MNTWLWGPPTWKVLHTLSYSPAAPNPDNAVTITRFLSTLTHALPCVYCRVSYDGFTRELQRQFGGRKVQAVIEAGELASWMYELHDKVNAKLDRQHAESLGLKGDDLLKRCRRRQITFDCLTKRFALQPIAFCADDVFDLLQIFALNMDTSKSKPLPMQESVRVPHIERRRYNQLQFFLQLPRVIGIALSYDAPLVAALSHLSEPVLSAGLKPGSQPDALLRHVTEVKLWFAHPRGFTPEALETQLAADTTRLQRAFAKKCEHGSCS